MNDLVQPQIKDNCKLALPNGLKEFMSDITREVLRYQPSDIYKFIADYLSALLITRDNLSIASYICDDLARCSCEPDLHTELRDIGLSEDEIKTAADIIVNYLEKGKGVDEGNLMMELIGNTNLAEDMLPAIQDAIRFAYLRHQAHNTAKYESSSNSEHDVVMCAAKHTLDLYRKTAPSQEAYNIMAEKIEKSYRAYGLKRDSAPKKKAVKVADKVDTKVDYELRPQTSNCYDIAFPKMAYSEEAVSIESSVEDQDLRMSATMNKNRIKTISSTSLAGSIMTLPPHKPYSVHDADILSDLNEYPEIEHAHIDYTADDPRISMVTDEKLICHRDNKQLSFIEEAKNLGLETADDDSLSKDSNMDDSIMGADSDIFYSNKVMRVEGNYDGDTEMESSDMNVAGSQRHVSHESDFLEED